MPRRPDSHVVADIALNRVMSICADYGWAVEVVHKDYGDDLLVQPNYYGLIDHNRIWIQVKGTRNIDGMRHKDFGYSIMVSLDHAFKWARSADLSVVVLWDIEKDFGLWCIPKDNMDEWNWRTLKSTKLRLIFNENSIFNKEQLQQLGWLARIDHYATLIMKAHERDISYFQFEGETSVPIGSHKSWVPLVAFDFLKLLFILGSESSVDKGFVKSIRNAKTHILKTGPLEPGEDSEYMATILAILGRVHHLSNGCGVPNALLEACTEVAYVFVQATRNRKSRIVLRKLMG